MNFVDTFEVKSRENAVELIAHELSMRAVAKLDEIQSAPREENTQKEE